MKYITHFLFDTVPMWVGLFVVTLFIRTGIIPQEGNRATIAVAIIMSIAVTGSAFLLMVRAEQEQE